MAASQRSTLIPAEYPLVSGSSSDTPEGSGRPGVTYSMQTVRVPSDRRLIMIPASIPIPLNSTIAAVLFAPITSNSAPNEAGNPTSAFSGEAGSLYDAVTLASADDCGTFVHLDIQPPPAETQSLVERGRSIVAALIREANSGSGGRLPTVAEESPGPANLGGDSAQADDNLNDDEGLASISDVESDALTFGTNTPQLHHQILSTTHTSPEVSSAASGPAHSSKKRTHEEPEAGDIEKPKKPRNSFFYFRREYHKQTNANGGRAKAKNISGLAGKEWKEMTEEQKEPYKQFAAEDTVRYKQETRVYKESLKKGKKKAKPIDKSVESSIDFAVDTGRIGGSCRSTPANEGLVLSRLEPVPMLTNMGNSTQSADYLSYMPDVAVEVAAEFQHTPGLFGEPMIMTVNPNGVLTTDVSTRPAFMPADYSGHAIASGSMGPPPLPLAMTAQNHSSIFQPISEHQFAFDYQYVPDHNNAHLHQHQHQQFPHHQPHHYPQADHAQMQHWSNLSSLLDNLGTPVVSNPFDESFFPAFREPRDQILQSTMPESTEHTAHIDQAMAMLNSHQLNVVTTTAGAEVGGRLNGSASTPEQHTGFHPLIPDIEIVDASNSISLSTYSIARRG
ncbi:hypothetical protein IWW37_005105 [Coemansia sp. RSA 2050]|nr:hypothetical protein IWW37_005105 [Coemansia sp. RSA 2050]KAJ2730716.1 hypothetical protein IW152_005050 [Coemansia sp. BCRC 34962]